MSKVERARVETLQWQAVADDDYRCIYEFVGEDGSRDMAVFVIRAEH